MVQFSHHLKENVLNRDPVSGRSTVSLKLLIGDFVVMPDCKEGLVRVLLIPSLSVRSLMRAKKKHGGLSFNVQEHDVAGPGGFMQKPAAVMQVSHLTRADISLLYSMQDNVQVYSVTG